MTKQKLLLGAKNGGEQRIKMTREEIISMLSTELDEKWDNGITCLMVEDSDAYIPVIVHHQKDGLIVEVEEQDKKIYQKNILVITKKIIEISHNLTHRI